MPPAWFLSTRQTPASAAFYLASYDVFLPWGRPSSFPHQCVRPARSAHVMKAPPPFGGAQSVSAVRKLPNEPHGHSPRWPQRRPHFGLWDIAGPQTEAHNERPFGEGSVPICRHLPMGASVLWRVLLPFVGFDPLKPRICHTRRAGACLWGRRICCLWARRMR